MAVVVFSLADIYQETMNQILDEITEKYGDWDHVDQWFLDSYGAYKDEISEHGFKRFVFPNREAYAEFCLRWL